MGNEHTVKVVNAAIAKGFKSPWKVMRWLSPTVIKLDIGPLCPWITGVKCYKTDVYYARTTARCLTLEVGFVGRVRPSLKMVLADKFKFELTEFALNGVARIAVTPLLTDEKLFGECQVTLMKLPHVDYAFQGCLSFLNWPFVKMAAVFAVKQLVYYVVSPRKLKIPNDLVDDVSKHAIETTVPEGILRFSLVKAKNMQSRQDPLVTVISRPNPYFVVRFGARTVKSRVAMKSSKSEFSLTKDFPVAPLDKYEQIKVELYDWKAWAFSEDVLLGFTTLSVGKLVSKGTCEDWYFLAQAEADTKVLIRTQFVPVKKATKIPRDVRLSSIADNDVVGLLVVLIYNVQAHPPCAPMVRIDVSGTEACVSSVGKHSSNYEYLEEFM